MSALESSTSERTSIHEMIKEASPKNIKSSNECVQLKYPITLFNSASSPAILTPGSPDQEPQSKSSLFKSASKIDNLKSWSISTYKCTKQLMFELLGKSSRTVDTELERQIECLRDTQKKYINILCLARTLTNHFYNVVQTQHALGEVFSDLAQKSPELQEEFLYNADTQRNLTRNGETLLGALTFFTSSISTLCNKTMEDTIQSVRQYEASRIEYDAYRSDLESISTKPEGSLNLNEAQKDYELHRQQFMKLRAEVAVKLKFLDENRIKVMHKQLLLFHNAISAYFSGNQTMLESTLKQFNIKVRSQSSCNSWMEQ